MFRQYELKYMKNNFEYWKMTPKGEYVCYIKTKTSPKYKEFHRIANNVMAINSFDTLQMFVTGDISGDYPEIFRNADATVKVVFKPFSIK